jgi:hypothetical protein
MLSLRFILELIVLFYLFQALFYSGLIYQSQSNIIDNYFCILLFFIHQLQNTHQGTLMSKANNFFHLAISSLLIFNDPVEFNIGSLLQNLRLFSQIFNHSLQLEISVKFLLSCNNCFVL